MCAWYACQASLLSGFWQCAAVMCFQTACVLRVQVPQLAALYHNDCLHVANELLTLPVVFAGPLKAVTGGIPPDFIPEVRDGCKSSAP